IMMTSGISRADRILAVYPMMFAAGAVAIERLGRLGRTAIVGMLVIGTLPPLPLVLPILPPPRLIEYSKALAVTPQLEIAKRGAMPQWLGDKRGWPEVVSATVAAYGSLTPEDQRQTVVFGADYGIAGALELDGRWGAVMSTHDAFWTWGPRPGAIVLAVGHDQAYWDALYADVRRSGTVTCSGCLVDGTAIWIVKDPRPGVAARWPALRRFE
ncbi:MAG TPA: hypothetical protein VGC41_13480, partial [Kofleriaceae bacterium]